MRHIQDDLLCQRMELKSGQIRRIPVHRNVWWSFDYGQTAFGFGDLDAEDLMRIQLYLSDEENRNKVFTGWHENHGTQVQHTDRAQVRVSWAAGATRPYDAYLEMRMR